MKIIFSRFDFCRPCPVLSLDEVAVQDMSDSSNITSGLFAGKYLEGGGGSKADKLRPLLKMMQFIGAVSGGRSIAQVALNYLVTQGTKFCSHLFGPDIICQ